MQPDSVDRDKGRPRGRPDYHLVGRANGPDWDHSKGRREQAQWDEHAAFMDALTEEGFVVLGGPAGEGDGEYNLLVIKASGEESIRARFADDPWEGSILTISSVKPWWVWLRAPVRP